jgi:hypothetical protein
MKNLEGLIKKTTSGLAMAGTLSTKANINLKCFLE